MSIVVATSSGTRFLGSQRVHILQGTAWASESEAVKAWPDMFSDDPALALGLDLVPEPKESGSPVESKTANPGEKSNAKRIFGRGR